MRVQTQFRNGSNQTDHCSFRRPASPGGSAEVLAQSSRRSFAEAEKPESRNRRRRLHVAGGNIAAGPEIIFLNRPKTFIVFEPQQNYLTCEQVFRVLLRVKSRFPWRAGLDLIKIPNPGINGLLEDTGCLLVALRDCKGCLPPQKLRRK